MGEDVALASFTRDDNARHRVKVRRCLDAFALMLDQGGFDSHHAMTGLEIELDLVDAAAGPAMCGPEVLANLADPTFQPELGLFNLEFNARPRLIAGGGLADYEQDLLESLKRAGDRAARVNARLLQIGILPTLTADHAVVDSLSPNPRYRLLNEQILNSRTEHVSLDIRGPERLRVTTDSIAPEAAGTSVQFHLQVAPESFAAYWNASQAIAGVQVALGANSPSCSAAGSGMRPGSCCSSSPPTRDRRSCGRKGCVRERGSVSVGSAPSSTCFRRTSATSLHCFPSVKRRTQSTSSTLAGCRGWASCDCTTAPSTAGTARSTTS